ncbi:MAG: flagellar hook-associated protein FlgL [Giesbergeria sp.]
MSNSMYRVATANMYESAIRNIGTRQTSLANLQENLSSGKRVVRASDDPVAAAQAERAMTRITRIQTEQRALDTQRNAVAQAESTLGDAISLMQEMRELVVSAGSGVFTNSDRATVTNQLQGLRAQLQNVANRKDTNGVPLLSALGSAAAPFLTALGEFDGLAGQVAGSGVTIPNTLDGDAAFMFRPQRDGVFNAHVDTATPATHSLGSSAITSNPSQIALDPSGNAFQYQISVSYIAGTAPGTLAAQYSVTSNPAGAPLNGTNPFTSADFNPAQPASVAVTAIPGLSLNLTGKPQLGDSVQLTLKPSNGIFDVVDSAIRDISAAGSSSDAAQGVGQALANMDSGLARLQTVRSYAGELLNRADRISGDQETRSVQLEGDRSRAEDLDMIKGISDFQNQQVGYEAALKSYTMVQKLSLFNFIS